jgi:hypothetical protein
VGAQSQVDVRFTWLIRADRHVGATFGDPAWAIKHCLSEWAKAQERGDEFGWMMYPAYSVDANWRQAYRDESLLVELVEEGYAAFQSSATAPRTMLMGWRGHRQRSMQRINDLGIQVDLSALPGWYTETRLGAVPSLGACDWEITPPRPFHPSASDYRRPIVYRGDLALELLEVPPVLVQSSIAPIREAVTDLFREGNLGLTRNYRRRRHGTLLQLDASPPHFQRGYRRLPVSPSAEGRVVSFVCPASRLESSASIHHMSLNLAWLLRQGQSDSDDHVSLTAREAYRSLTGGRLRMLNVEESCGHAHAHH